MRRYRYRCDRCHRTWPDRDTQAAAGLDRDRHRAAAHSGHSPHGDEVWSAAEDENTGLTRPARRLILGTLIGGSAMAAWRWLHRR